MEDKKMGNWQQRLCALDQLPEENVTDNQFAWEKLQGRLQQWRRRSAVWYWAAACLLALAAIPLSIFIMRSKRDIPVSDGPLARHVVQAPPQLLSGPQAVAMKKILSPFQDKRHAKTIQRFYSFSARPKKKPVPASGLETAAPVYTVHPSVSREPDSSITAATPILSKKLRVVHINELQNLPVLDPVQVAVNGYNKKHFRLQLGEHPPTNNALPPSNTLSIKLAN